MTVPESHPRYASLMAREALVEALEEGYLAEQGLIAHGRGEAFDYLLGEETTPPARAQARAGAAALVDAQHPVISVNGNVAALCPGKVATLQQALDAVVEVNLFHRTDERVDAIETRLADHGCELVLGADPDDRIPGLDSKRALVDTDGIGAADAVLVPLEDGDRTEALVADGKTVVAVDLNPLSRTARRASITIVDNVTRALDNLAETARLLDAATAREVLADFDNERAREATLAHLRDRLDDLADD
jgi:4-phosphopantoate--beta-alanine ligase